MHEALLKEIVEDLNVLKVIIGICTVALLLSAWALSAVSFQVNTVRQGIERSKIFNRLG